MDDCIVSIKNMYKIYNPGENEVRALDGVDLEVNRGEFVAIVGQSGSGKSTFMNMLGCLDTPTSGAYMLGGEDVSELTENELSDIRNRQIGFVFQQFNLIPALSALENVELPLIYRSMSAGERHRLAREALTRMGLEKRMKHRPNELSGGQQQRVAIARAIAGKPNMILLDEPTGALDSASGKEVMRIVHELHEEGKTIILITHDQKIAQQAQRIVNIVDGRIESDSGRVLQAAGI